MIGTLWMIENLRKQNLTMLIYLVKFKLKEYNLEG